MPVFTTKTSVRLSTLLQILVYLLTASGCSQLTNSRHETKPEPFADVHLHFNQDQQEGLSAADAVEHLRKNNVVLGIVSSVPSHYARKLGDAGNGWIIPLFSPYITAEHRRTWFRDPEVLHHAREGLGRGWYQGIGELHLWDGMKPQRDNSIFQALLAMAIEFNVPVLIHTESANHRYFAEVCQQHPGVRFLWAHAGGTLKAKSVATLMALCPNVWIDLSARDPWRYNTLVAENGKLPDNWIALIIRYPDRVMVGSDPVWNVTRTQSWDEADAGWDHISELTDFHRKWMKQLAPEIEEKLRLVNARIFFRSTLTDSHDWQPTIHQ